MNYINLNIQINIDIFMKTFFIILFLSFLSFTNSVDIDYSVESMSDSTIIQDVNNKIYFYGPVSHRSSFELKNKINKADMQSQLISQQYNIEPPPIHLQIQSEGGSLFHTLYIIDLIKTLRTPVYTYIDGFAASAATLISIAGKKRYISHNSLMLIHQLSGSKSGKFEELKDQFYNLQGLMDIIKKIYLENTKIPKEHLESLLKQDIWLDSTKCLQYGLVDKILK